LVAAMAVPPAVRAEPDADTVVARVNGEEITIGHVIIAHATLPSQYRQLPADVLYNAIVDQLIQQTALKQSFDGDQPRHVRLPLANERRSLLAAEEVENIMEAAVGEEDIRAAYDAQFGDGFGEEEFNASHILVETRAEADATTAALDG